MSNFVMICSNQFLSQEPGTNEEIKKFARDKGFKGVLMDKVDVNGPKACPVYNFLKVGTTLLHKPQSLIALCDTRSATYGLRWVSSLCEHVIVEPFPFSSVSVAPLRQPANNMNTVSWNFFKVDALLHPIARCSDDTSLAG